MKKAKNTRWHASEESNALIFDVCKHFLDQFSSKQENDSDDSGSDSEKKGAAGTAQWVSQKWNRNDISREKIYPLLAEGIRRGFLFLQTPVEKQLPERLKNKFHLENHEGTITVVDIAGKDNSAIAEGVTSQAADQVIYLIDEVARQKAQKEGKEISQVKVHLGMGAGLVSMLVAQKLAQRVRSGKNIPCLVLHAISTGGFFIAAPHKAPITYFSYFDEIRSKVEYIALFAHTVVPEEEYAKIKENPGLRLCFERKNEIDIIITSMAGAQHKHGLLRQYFEWLIDNHLINSDTITNMEEAGWIGDVQFQPYTKDGILEKASPFRAVTLFDLNELVEFAKTPGKYIVLVGGPCGECGELKTDPLRPLLANDHLRLWTHLILDVKTANELLAAM
ncbi:MAG: hypothetical protein Q4G69_06870 [Planctomycetia bacterium]|nr:hypothetical protein [Planctomycetia bacterium]